MVDLRAEELERELPKLAEDIRAIQNDVAAGRTEYIDIAFMSVLDRLEAWSQGRQYIRPMGLAYLAISLASLGAALSKQEPAQDEDDEIHNHFQKGYVVRSSEPREPCACGGTGEFYVSGPLGTDKRKDCPNYPSCSTPKTEGRDG